MTHCAIKIPLRLSHGLISAGHFRYSNTVLQLLTLSVNVHCHFYHTSLKRLVRQWTDNCETAWTFIVTFLSSMKLFMDALLLNCNSSFLLWINLLTARLLLTNIVTNNLRTETIIALRRTSMYPLHVYQRWRVLIAIAVYEFSVTIKVSESRRPQSDAAPIRWPLLSAHRH